MAVWGRFEAHMGCFQAGLSLLCVLQYKHFEWKTARTPALTRVLPQLTWRNQAAIAALTL